MESLDDSGFDGRSPPPPTSRPKRPAVETVAELDEMLRNRLSLTKRHTGEEKESTISPISSRPSTRRSVSSDFSPNQKMLQERKSLRSALSGNSVKNVRHIAALSTDSISPRSIQQMSSPRRKIQLESPNPYSKHRLGQTFSPMMTGAKKRSISIFKNSTPLTQNTPSPQPGSSPKRLRNISGSRMRPSLVTRLNNQSLE